MALATTEKYEELVLEVEFDPVGNSGVFSRVCGLIDVTVTRTANVDTAEIPDCDDESLPLSVERQVRAIEVTVSGEGVWAQESHGNMTDWFYSSAPLNARIQNVNAASGDTEFEAGPALLTNLTDGRTKGQKVSRSVEIQFDGTPVRTAKS